MIQWKRLILLIIASFEISASEATSIKNRLSAALFNMQQSVLDYSRSMRQYWSHLRPEYRYATAAGAALLTAAALYRLRAKKALPPSRPEIIMERYEIPLSPKEISKKIDLIEADIDNTSETLISEIKNLFSHTENKGAMANFKSRLEIMQNRIEDNINTLKTLKNPENNGLIEQINNDLQIIKQRVTQLLDLSRRILLLHFYKHNEQFYEARKEIKEELQTIYKQCIEFKLNANITTFVKRLLKANAMLKDHLLNQNVLNAYTGDLQTVKHFLTEDSKRLEYISSDKNAYDDLHKAHNAIAHAIDEALALVNERNLLYQIKNKLIKEHGLIAFWQKLKELNSKFSAITENLQSL